MRWLVSKFQMSILPTIRTVPVDRKNVKSSSDDHYDLTRYAPKTTCPNCHRLVKEDSMLPLDDSREFCTLCYPKPVIIETICPNCKRLVDEDLMLLLDDKEFCELCYPKPVVIETICPNCKRTVDEDLMVLLENDKECCLLCYPKSRVDEKSKPAVARRIVKSIT